MSTALVLLMIPGVGYVPPITSDYNYKPNTNEQLFLLRSCPEKISFIATMAFCNGNGSRFLSMVFLGIFSGFLAQGWQIHRCSGQFWPHGCASAAICCQRSNTRSALLRLPRHVRLYHVSAIRGEQDNLGTDI